MNRAIERDQEGVALVELAILITFLTVLVFGFIEFGNTLSDYQNLRQGVREATREAAANPAKFTTSADFGNFIVSTTGLDSSRLTISWTSTGTFNSGDVLRVCVRYSTQSITGYAGLFLPSSLSSNVAMRMEPYPSSTFPKPVAGAPVVTSLAPCS